MKIVHAVAWFRHAASVYERIGVKDSKGDERTPGEFFGLFARMVVRAHRAVWGDDADLWIYHDEIVADRPEFPALKRAQHIGLLKLINMRDADTLCGSMMWRLLPVYDRSVDWVMCRDWDGLMMHRDRKMVEEAIAAGAAAHVIHDSPSHSGPLMGGTSSFHAPTFRDLFVQFPPPSHQEDLNRHGADQRILNTYVYPRVKDRLFIHQIHPTVRYPGVMRTEPCLPAETPLDKAAPHIGCVPEDEADCGVLREHYPDPLISAIEAAEGDCKGCQHEWLGR